MDGQTMKGRGKGQLASSSQSNGIHLPNDEQREYNNTDQRRIKQATAGVFVQATKETMSICKAKSKGLLTPGTSLLLLEVQAATGYMIDPVKNRKLSVEEAVATGVVDAELKKKLQSAERAVTGYVDPYSGNVISLFQAIKKDLIVKDHGIRLLEAQIATGGIIDPVHRQRVPVEVAYQRGYFDEEIKKILLDPDNDTKGFFDPNTKENLTYLQLVERCMTDPKTALSLLVIAQKRGEYYFVDEKTKSVVKSTITTTEKTPKNDKENFQGIRKDVTADELLECKIIDKKMYDDLRAGKLTIKGVSEMDFVRKYLQGTNSIAGVFVQSTKQVMSISEAKSEGILTAGTSLVLLEAQAATGYVIDPVKNRKMSVEEAVATGVVDAGLKKKLLSAERAVTGYTDPYTGDIISLFQAIKKDLIVKDHGIRLLEAQIATGGIIDPVHSHRVPVEVAYQRGYFDEEMNQILSDADDDTKGFFDPNTQENLTYLQLIERCVTDPKTALSLLVIAEKGGKYPFVDEKRKSVVKSTITTTEKTQRNDKENFQGIRKDVTADELLECKIIDEKLYDDLCAGRVTIKSVSEMDSVHKYLQGTNSIAGVFVQSTKQVMSISEAKSEGILTAGTSMVLLEAQAATGFIIDPVENRKMSVEEAVATGVVDAGLKKKLLSAERAVTGYTDPYTDDIISLFQAIKKDLIVKDHGIRLLEAQIATGGIIDPVHSHRVPVEVAYQRGYFDEEMNQILSDADDDTKGFFDPNTQENLTYLQLIERCVTDPNTALSLLVIAEEGEDYPFVDEKTKSVVKSTVPTTEKTQRKDKENFQGIRKDVTADELLECKIIDQELYDDLKAGKVTIESVSEMDSVRMYLQGTNSIAGVFVQSTEEVMSISEAKSKGILTAGTSLVLLEAQAATGYVIDPVENRKMSVEEAVATGVVDEAMKNKLLSAERAVTGYIDPYTDDIISLFQAIKKDLIVKDHGIRLLEAQIATGGIIDPVHSHRVPVEVAYQRGYFDEEMNEILSDPDDDTKGFFDPNTQENLTYLQLIERCVIDPNTGLSLLSLNQ